MGFFKTISSGVRKIFGGKSSGNATFTPVKSLREIQQERQQAEAKARNKSGWGAINRPTPATFTPMGDAEFTLVSDEVPPILPVVSDEQLEREAEQVLSRAGVDEQENAYLNGEVTEVTSSNVSWIQYLWKYPGPNGEPLAGPDQNELFIGYHDGSVYQYEQISFDEALAMYRANSKGGFVWDNLRVRGTVFGYQKPYRLVSGHRVWNAAGPESQARHEAIPKSGEPYEGYHPATNYKQAKGAMGAEGVNLGKKGSKKKAYFTAVKAKTEHSPRKPRP